MKGFSAVCKTNRCSWNGCFTCLSSPDTFMAPITAICFLHSKCFVRSLAPPACCPCPWCSALHRSPALSIRPLGEPELEPNCRFYLVERWETCDIGRKLSRKSWMFTTGSKAYLCNRVWAGINIWPQYVFRCGLYWWKWYLKEGNEEKLYVRMSCIF